MNDTSVNEYLANLLFEAELDEYRVANYQITLLFMKSVDAKLRQIRMVFDCAASVVPWEQAPRLKAISDDELIGRQKFLGDLFLLFGCPVKEVVTKLDGSLCIKFDEARAIVLHLSEDCLDADDWIWRVDDENKRGVSCVVVQTNSRRDIRFLVK